jgi:hypothetical protein
MDRYNVVLIQPDGYVHSLGVYEIGKLLMLSFISLGIPCRFHINTFERDAVNILLGYQLLPAGTSLPPYRSVCYQLEQLSNREGWYTADLHALLRQMDSVWDYSAENVQFLRAQGIADVHHLPIGFHPGLQTIKPRRYQDIDVLFYGSINSRRQAVLELLDRETNLVVLFGSYGNERDAFIARSKIVLNVHFYESQIMEQARISYLLNNAVFVLSEHSPSDTYGGIVEAVPYAEIVDRCRYFLSNAAERTIAAREAYDRFREWSMVTLLEQVLAAPCHGPPLENRTR